MTKLIIILLLFSCLNISNQEIASKKETKTSSKINGVSFVSINDKVDDSHFTPVKALNANWVAIMPFGFLKDNSATVQYNSSRQWFGETPSGVINYIKTAQKNNLNVCLKPHLWLWNGWVGDLNFENEEDWNEFESTYTNYILEFAKIADSLNVELFSVGVELKKSATLRPAYWKNLISEVKKIYKGKLTYSANWDNYQNITFWNKLDYMGIDAYFPIANSQSPTLAECSAGWKKQKTVLKAYYDKIKKPILFTEYGYRNIDYTGNEPWNEKQNSTNNISAQNNAYQALYTNLWDKEWFAGGFLWKWFPDYSKAGGKENNRFTPQNKPVEVIIKHAFSTI